MRVPVVSIDGEPLMPTTPAKARKMLKGGVAKKRWNKLGQFYIQMLQEVGKEKQPLKLGIDYGSKYDGYAVGGNKEVCLKAMAKMPEKVAKKNADRRRLRRARRNRKWRRPCRFDNRKRPEGWIAPSQRAKLELRQKIVKELSNIYPIGEIGVEDVAFNHYKYRHGKYFSTAEIGKTTFYETLKEIAPLTKFKGWQTSKLLKKYSIPKTGKKDKIAPESHSNDAVAMLCGIFGSFINHNSAYFWYWQRPEFSKRLLHRQHHQKGGIRPRFGGTTNGGDLRKGDYVLAEKSGKEHRGWVCGLPTEKTPMVGICDSRAKRIGQFSVNKTNLIRRSTGVLWSQFLPPSREGTPCDK